MKPHAARQYNEQFEQVTTALVTMGGKVHEAMEIARQSLHQRDDALRMRAKANDKEINALHEQVNIRIADLFAMHHPMADDLRFAISALKISAALERIGDIAKGITKRMVRLEAPFPPQALDALEKLVVIDREMIEDALTAVRTRDKELATRIWKRDEEADEVCRQVFRNILGATPGGTENMPLLVDILFAAKNFERMADYATGIAKAVIYIETGVKPHKSILDEI